MMEGWYYNLALAYVVSCEKRIADKIDLFPLAEFDRDEVPAFHPSFVFILLLASTANTFQLFEFTLKVFGNGWAIFTAAVYGAILFLLALLGRVPRRIDASLEKMDRTRRKRT